MKIRVYGACIRSAAYDRRATSMFAPQHKRLRRAGADADEYIKSRYQHGYAC